MRARSGVEIAVRENAETQTRINVKNVMLERVRGAAAGAHRSQKGRAQNVCVRRHGPIFSCTRGLYLMFLNRVCTRSHTWVVTSLGRNDSPGKCDRATLVTRLSPGTARAGERIRPSAAGGAALTA